MNRRVNNLSIQLCRAMHTSSSINADSGRKRRGTDLHVIWDETQKTIIEEINCNSRTYKITFA